MGRRRPAEGRLIVYFRGVAHEMDDELCRVALIRCQIAGEVDSMQGLADALGISRSTVSRFFSRRPGSLATALRILGKLGLRFDEVFRPIGRGDDPNEPS
jgi:hypothetical protein